MTNENGNSTSFHLASFCQFIFCNIIFSQFCNLSQKVFVCFVFYLGHPRPLFCLLSSFQTNIKILTTNKCEKCPSSTWCRDLNSQPSERKPPPITTRPLLPTIVCIVCCLFLCLACFRRNWKTFWQENNFKLWHFVKFSSHKTLVTNIKIKAIMKLSYFCAAIKFTNKTVIIINHFCGWSYKWSTIVNCYSTNSLTDNFQSLRL